MKKITLAEAQIYSPPKHNDMKAMRLHGKDVSGCENFWVGLSHFLPGGGAEKDASPSEKVYVVLSGEVTVKTATQTVILGPTDSLYIPPNEEREVVNNTRMPASMLVISPSS